MRIQEEHGCSEDVFHLVVIQAMTMMVMTVVLEAVMTAQEMVLAVMTTKQTLTIWENRVTLIQIVTAHLEHPAVFVLAKMILSEVIAPEQEFVLALHTVPIKTTLTMAITAATGGGSLGFLITAEIAVLANNTGAVATQA